MADTINATTCDNEPFCETVKRWLNGDAPKECHECEDGYYHELKALLANECDNCEPANKMQAEIERLKAGNDYLLDEIERQRYVIEAQANSFQKLERELKEATDFAKRVEKASINDFRKEVEPVTIAGSEYVLVPYIRED